MYAYVHFRGDDLKKIVPISFVKDLENPHCINSRKLFKVFWSPDENDTPETLLQRYDEIPVVEDGEMSNIEHGVGYYRASILLVKDTLEELTEYVKSSRIRAPPKQQLITSFEERALPTTRPKKKANTLETATLPMGSKPQAKAKSADVKPNILDVKIKKNRSKDRKVSDDEISFSDDDSEDSDSLKKPLNTKEKKLSNNKEKLVKKQAEPSKEKDKKALELKQNCAILQAKTTAAQSSKNIFNVQQSNLAENKPKILPPKLSKGGSLFPANKTGKTASEGMPHFPKSSAPMKVKKPEKLIVKKKKSAAERVPARTTSAQYDVNIFTQVARNVVESTEKRKKELNNIKCRTSRDTSDDSPVSDEGDYTYSPKKQKKLEEENKLLSSENQRATLLIKKLRDKLKNYEEVSTNPDALAQPNYAPLQKTEFSSFNSTSSTLPVSPASSGESTQLEQTEKGWYFPSAGGSDSMTEGSFSGIESSSPAGNDDYTIKFKKDIKPHDEKAAPLVESSDNPRLAHSENHDLKKKDKRNLSLEGSYILYPGKVLPAQLMTKIWNKARVGEHGDSQFVKDAAVLAWGRSHLLTHSVKGRKRKGGEAGLPRLDDERIQAVRAFLKVKVQRDLGMDIDYQNERLDLTRIHKYIQEKIRTLKDAERKELADAAAAALHVEKHAAPESKDSEDNSSEQ